MDEHPGDTLGKRFLTFWGALAAIAAVAVLLGLYRWIVLPSDTKEFDGDAGKNRLEILSTVNIEQQKEFNTAAEVDKGKTVPIPPDKVIPWAAGVLAKQKPAPTAIKSFATLTREGAANPASPAPAPNPAPAPAQANPAPAPAPGAK